MIISSLVAMNADRLIGVNNDLPWKLKDDLEGLVDDQTIRTKMSECLQAAKDRVSNS